MHGRKVAIFGVFTALALIFSYVELLIPINFGIPGAKLGLANLMTVLVLYKMGIKEALALSVTRIILSGFMFGNLFGILYSLSGGLLSFLVMVSLRNQTGSVLPESVLVEVQHIISGSFLLQWLLYRHIRWGIICRFC
mgnify:CR=1 FL=1